MVVSSFRGLMSNTKMMERIARPANIAEDHGFAGRRRHQGGGHVHGATDEAGFAAVRDKVHVHDLHVTILHLLGLDHERLTYRYAGRDFRLTDVRGRVVRELVA
jgi:hypothetical protein